MPTPMLLLLPLLCDSVAGHLDPRAEDAATPAIDRSLLAIQIGGIVAAYVIFVAILLGLLLFVGRRLRRRVQASNYSLQVEMMRPAKPPPSTDPSPVTPSSANFSTANTSTGANRSWTSFGRPPKSHGSRNGSVGTIDESVVASDRQRAQNDLEKLYAAVMEHDEQKTAGETDGESPESTQTNPFADPSSAESERPPGPPLAQMKPPTSPRSNSRLSKISSLSLLNSNSRASTGSGSKLRSPVALRKLPISSPIGSPDATATDSYGEDQPPLTPRLYNPGPPPQAPPSQPSPGKGAGAGRAPAPAPLSLTTASHGATNKGINSLPFRDAYPLQSAPATKTTIIERPAQSKSGPRTGVPTPYSPYMPFTPVTPLTPSRVVTKRQRKREGKDNGLRVLNEDDMVKDEDDMWGC